MTADRHIGALNRVGLIGDVHAEDELLEQALEFLSDTDNTDGALDALLCTGDVADGGGCIDRSCQLLQRFDVHTVAGNHDRWLLTDRVRHVEQAHRIEQLSADTRAYLRGLPKTVRFDSPMGPGLLCHGVESSDLSKVWPGSPRLDPERNSRLDEIIASERYRVMLNGHMHFRCLIHFAGLSLLNAGTLKPRHRPGFSIVDFNNGDIHAYEFDASDCLHVMTRNLTPSAEDRVWHNTQAFDGNWEPTTLYSR